MRTLLLLILALPAAAQDWTIDPGRSSLGFEVAVNGQPLTGTFETWDGEIRYDPAAPQDGTVVIVIDMGSVTTSMAQAEQTLPAADWFDVGGFPEARFEGAGFVPGEGDRFVLPGTLTLKGVSVPLELTGTVTVDGDTATAELTAPLDRQAHGVGAGVGDSTAGAVVTVTGQVVATR